MIGWWGSRWRGLAFFFELCLANGVDQMPILMAWLDGVELSEAEVMVRRVDSLLYPFTLDFI